VSKQDPIRRRALRLVQDSKHPLYLFALKAEELLDVADISRVSRDDAGELLGYQRPEVKRHVENIVEYLDDNAEVLFPHALILALDSTVSFQSARGPKVDDGIADAGTLTIPRRRGGPKPAWIVDGQQRALALTRSKRASLVVPVAAFVADDIETQREQFLRINTTRPLPRGLVTELLPKVSTVLPQNLAAKRAPAAIVDLLNRTADSPFFQLVRRSSDEQESKKGHVVTDTSLILTLSESLSNSSGCLFSYRNLSTGETDYAAVMRLVTSYWNAVRATWPEAWGKAPSQSRLMHSVGIRAMGKLMDRIMGSIDLRRADSEQTLRTELAALRPHCAWTSGEWEFGVRWNELQNIPAHVRVLSNHLVRAYLQTRRG
jgi:DGQHR domain-containing protein